ncbi:MAG: glycosyltransferase family 2 protein [Gammaproteobacteria bacterium]
MPKLSVIIITHNEISNIADCLDSVSFADEIIVVDNRSTDGTIEFCRQKGAKITVTSDWPGFGPQKNRALQLAQGPWILSIDADERVTPELTAEIQAILHHQDVPRHDRLNGYKIPRLSNYCGRWMKHSGWHPDYVLRLFLKDQAKFSDDLIHERILLQGNSAKLSHPLLHYSFPNLESVLNKINRYSTDTAQMRFQKGQKSSLTKAIFKGLWAFFKTYFIQRGFLDGREGFILAVSNAEGTYYRYLKLMYKN